MKTTWSPVASQLIILIPEASPPYDSDPSSSIEDSLRDLFEPSSRVTERTFEAEDTEWATVNLPTRAEKTANVTPTSIPLIKGLARPERLFSSQLPYLMVVQIIHNGIIVQGSHQPSLRLLKDYFEKYTRIDRNDSTKVCRSLKSRLGTKILLINREIFTNIISLLAKLIIGRL